MKKKYLKTVEDVLALKDTDTKIYIEGIDSYYKFVKGVLCYFINDGRMFVNEAISLLGERPYILEEEPMQEATEEDELALCVFWRGDSHKYYGVLDYIQGSGDFKMIGGSSFPHCRRLSPAEVAEITGYKVEETE